MVRYLIIGVAILNLQNDIIITIVPRKNRKALSKGCLNQIWMEKKRARERKIKCWVLNG